MKAKTVLFLLFISLLCGACHGKTKEDLLWKGRQLIGERDYGAAAVYLERALEKDPGYTDANYELASAYCALGKFDSAASQLNAILKKHPSDTRARLALARVYLEQSDSGKAFAELKKLPAGCSEEPRFLQEMGWAYAIEGDYPAALPYLHGAMQKEGCALTSVLMAKAYFNMGDMAKARDALNDALKADPSNDAALNLLASVQLRQGDVDGAIGTYARAGESDLEARFKEGMLLADTGRLAQAGALADRLISRFRFRPEGHMLKGIVLYDRKDYAGAEVSLRQSIEDGDNAQTHYYLGLCLLKTGDPELALSQLEIAAQLAPPFARAQDLAALILIRQGRTGEAIDKLNGIAAAGHADSGTRTLLGQAYLAQGRTKEAIAELALAAQESAGAALMLGGLYARQKDYRLAEGAYGMAERLAPGNAVAARLRAMALQGMGKYGPARAEYRKAIAADPRDVPALNNLAYLDLVAGDYNAALGLAAQAFALAPKNGDVLDTYGFALLENGRTADALKMLEKANALLPGNPNILYHMALAHKAMGDRDLAAGELRKSLKIGGFQDAGRARALLSEIEGRKGR